MKQQTIEKENGTRINVWIEDNSYEMNGFEFPGDAYAYLVRLVDEELKHTENQEEK